MGIGGIAMANVAVLLAEAGYRVAGSDQNVYEPAASILRRAGIAVRTPYEAASVPTSSETTIIVGNALSRGHVEVEEALRRNLPLESFSGFLRRTVMRDRTRIVVAGTHGKSSTTAAIAFLLSSTGHDPSYLIGADPLDLDFGGHAAHGLPFVIEGDEYDSAFFDKRSKFLDYFPQILVLGKVEHDHLDIFPTLEEMLISYRRLVQQLPTDGTLVVAADSEHAVDLAKYAPCSVLTVGEDVGCAWQLLDGGVRAPDGAILAESSLQVFGAHNLQNLALAIAAASKVEVSTSKLFAAARGFRGIKRRMECVLDRDGLIVYDDFAHHSTAIRAAIAAVRGRHPEANIVAAFEPRSNTATRCLFQHELTDALGTADHVAIGSIHRKEKIPSEVRLDPDAMCTELKQRGVRAASVPNADLPEFIQASLVREKQNVVLFMSNGSFDGACQRFCGYYNL